MRYQDLGIVDFSPIQIINLCGLPFFRRFPNADLGIVNLFLNLMKRSFGESAESGSAAEGIR